MSYIMFTMTSTSSALLILAALVLLALPGTHADLCFCTTTFWFGLNNRGTFSPNTLHNASAEQNVTAVKQLLQAHADPNAVETKLGTTPLHLALASTTYPDDPLESRSYSEYVYGVVAALLAAVRSHMCFDYAKSHQLYHCSKSTRWP